jgi:IPT/TIG domain.
MDKQNFQSIGRRLRCCCFLFSIWGLLTLGACSDDKSDSSIAYDPSQPVTITDFEPKEGAMCTDMFITGNNFGTDISKIEVKIGDKAIKVVGSNGKKSIVLFLKNQAPGQSV